jgi:multiple sugar transport system substrate-binding protein
LSLLICAAAALLLLAGCTVPVAPVATPQAEAPAAAPAPPAPAAAPAAVTIRYSNWQWEEPGLQDFWANAVAAFSEANPGITVEKYGIPWKGYYDKVTTEVQSGAAADVMMITFDRYHQFRAMGALTPLDNYLAKTDILERFQEQQKTDLAIDGKIYGVISYMRNWQINYNKAFYEEAGLAIPTTPEEFLDAAVKLTKKRADGTVERYGYAMATQSKDGGMYSDVFFWVNGFGGNFAKDGVPTATDPNTVAAIKFLKKMFDSGAMPSGVGFGTYQQWFPEGKLAMLHGGQQNWVFVEKQNPDLLKDVGFFPAPFPNATSPGGIQGILVISKDSKHPEEAFKFIEFVSQPDWQRSWLMASKMIPAQKGIADQAYVDQYPYMQVFMDAMPYARPIAPPGFEVYSGEFQKIVEDAVEKILYTNADVDATMAQLQAELEAFVASKK